MTRARHSLAAAAWLAWWAPSIALAFAALALDHARFEAVVTLGRVLAAIGCPRAASWVYGTEIRRHERETRAAEGRRGRDPRNPDTSAQADARGLPQRSGQEPE